SRGGLGICALNSVRETIAAARERNKPFTVVLNAAPPKRGDKEAPVVAHARAYLNDQTIPVWSGQISQRAAYSLTLAAGASACEWEPESTAAEEISALWSAIERSVEAINAPSTKRAEISRYIDSIRSVLMSRLGRLKEWVH